MQLPDFFVSVKSKSFSVLSEWRLTHVTLEKMLFLITLPNDIETCLESFGDF